MWCNLSVLSMSKIVMEQTTEHRAAISFCWKDGFSATKTFDMIQKVYGESSAHRATVFRWYNTFSKGRELICDEQRSGRPTTTRTYGNIVRVVDILKEDRRSSCGLVAEWIGIPKTIVQQIFGWRFTETETLLVVCAACIHSRTERTAP